MIISSSEVTNLLDSFFKPIRKKIGEAQEKERREKERERRERERQKGKRKRLRKRLSTRR